MGMFDLFHPQATTPLIPSAMPDAAKQQILHRQLPILQPNNLFLKSGELCHYADRAIYEKRTVSKRQVRKNAGYSIPGLFKGTRIYMSAGDAECVDDVKYSTIKGVLYITTRRIIFVGNSDGFERKINDLIAATPYANCIELHFSKDALKVFVPDGNLPYIVLRLMK